MVSLFRIELISWSFEGGSNETCCRDSSRASVADRFVGRQWRTQRGTLPPLVRTLINRTASRCRRDYILPLWFFLLLLSFSRRLISEVTERISNKLGHIFTYDCYLKNFVPTPPGIYPHGLGATSIIAGAKQCLRPTLNFYRTYLCNGTWYQQSERNLSIYRTPLHVLKFGELWLRNGWERLASFCPPLNFCIRRLPTLPHGRYITDSRQTLTRVI